MRQRHITESMCFVPLDQKTSDEFAHVNRVHIKDMELDKYYIYIFNNSDYEYLIYQTDILHNLGKFSVGIHSDFDEASIWVENEEDIGKMKSAIAYLEQFRYDPKCAHVIPQIIYMMNLAIEMRTCVAFQY